MPPQEPRPRLPMLGLSVAAIVGIAGADLARLPLGWPLAGAGLMALAAFFRPRTFLAWLFVALAFFCLHTMRHYGSEGRLVAEAIGPAPAVAEATGIVWSEPEKPRVWSRNVTAHFLLKLERLRIHGTEHEASAVVQVRWAGPMPDYGDRVSLLGSIRPLAVARNPGQFDIRAVRERQGIYQELESRYASDDTILGHGQGAWWQELALESQRWIRHNLELDLQDAPEVSALIESMVLGAHGDTPDDLRDLFQRTGTMHLFAVSGFNVMMLGGLAWFVLKPLRISRGTLVALVIPLMAVYAVVTGFSASCVRASLTGSIVLAGYWVDRRPSALNSVAAAAFVILAADTEQPFFTGFQFTFTVVVLLILAAGPLHTWLRVFGRPDPFLPPRLWSWRQRRWAGAWSSFSELASVNFAGWCGSLVFTIGYFHLFSPSALLANLVAVPLAFLILYLSAGALAAGSVSHGLAGIFNNANWLAAKALLGVLGLAVSLPGGYAYLRPSLAPRPPCRFTVLDLGTGGAIHLQAPGADWLIDCGHGYQYEQIVRPYLHAQGVNGLAGLALTHGDAQHIGGALTVLDDFRPAQILDSPLKDRSSARRNFQAALVEREWPKRIVQRGDTVDLAPGVRLTVLYPPAGLQRSSAADKALVLRLEAAGHRALFTSDSGFFTEDWLLQHEPDLQAEVLVKGQHPKDLSGTPDFLRKVGPALIVSGMLEPAADAAAHAEWKQEVAAAGIALFPQEECGAVTVTMEPGGIHAESFLGSQTYRGRAR